MTTDTITLTYPIDVDGIETDTLIMRRPIVRDIKAISRIKDATESTIHLLSSLCTVPPEAIEQLDMQDFALLSKKIEGFMGIDEGK